MFLCPYASRPPRRQLVGRRRGAAAVEFALVAPVLFLFVFGIIEFGRAFMLKEATAGAARAGVRRAVVTSGTYTSATNTTKDRLVRAGVKNATVKVFVDGTEVSNDSDFKAKAVGGAIIRVQVNAPYKDNTWMPGQWFIKTSTILTEQVDGKREG